MDEGEIIELLRELTEYEKNLVIEIIKGFIKSKESG